MSLLFWGLTIGTFGKVIVVLAVLHMHHSLVKEHRIDKKVILSYRQERVLTFIGLILITLGYLLEITFYGEIDIICGGVSCLNIIDNHIYNF